MTGGDRTADEAVPEEQAGKPSQAEGDVGDDDVTADDAR